MPANRAISAHVINSFISLSLLGVSFLGRQLLIYWKETPEPTPPVDRTPAVEVVVVQKHTGTLDLKTDGVAAPFREISLAAEVAGAVRFKSLKCRAGTFVSKDELLVEIDNRDYVLEKEQLTQQSQQIVTQQQQLEVERKNTDRLIAIAKQQVALQESEVERLRDAGDSISQSQLDQAQRGLLTTRDQLQMLENQKSLFDSRKENLDISAEQAKTQLKQAELNLTRTKIAAPADGVIVRELVEQGSYVARGAPLVIFEDTSSVEVRCNLQVEELAWLWRTAPANPSKDPRQAYRITPTPATVVYRLADRRKYFWEGVLQRYDGLGVDEKTRTAPCRIAIPKPQQVLVKNEQGELIAAPASQGPPALVRGMYVAAYLHIQPPIDFLRIPEKAVQPGNQVWRIDNEQKLESRGPLELVRLVKDPQNPQQNYWLSPASVNGLQADDRLVITPIAGAYTGMPVKLEQ